jgi:DNA modification methylase
MNDISGTNWRVMFGSCLDRLKDLEDNSLDSVVTDPPYELGFMGKSWDSSGIAYNVEVWRECLRVLKPGGHVLAFGGSRTWHRLAVAVEDAGFEIRDSIAWIYGSGFPKSLDVSKAIDKRGGQGAILTKQIGEALREAREKRGISKTEADKIFCDGSTNWTWFEGRPTGQRPPSSETFSRIVEEWPELSDLAEMVAEAEREVIGTKTSGIANKEQGARHTIGASKAVEVDITAPATPEAVKWEGWGTALKPAHEPVVVGRKPLGGRTVAENVLEWGVGGLNIDGTRIGTTVETWPSTCAVPASGANMEYGKSERETRTAQTPPAPAGRWPSNVMLDEFTATLVDEQSGFSKSTGVINRWTDGAKPFGNGAGGDYESVQGVADSGGASRFFYVAKASKRDRNEGLDGLPEVLAPKGNYEGRDINNQKNVMGGGSAFPKARNFHPTVKPTGLMRQLVRLVTPSGGLVLDPFTGSGSTGKAAILEGFQFVGVELTEEYLPIIEGRLNHAVKLKAVQDLKDEEALF